MLPEAVAIVVAPTDPTRQVFFAHDYRLVHKVCDMHLQFFCS
jgi:hypothetical protein